MTKHEKNFRQLCAALIERGIFPSPTVLNQELGRKVRMNNINGQEVRWRMLVLMEMGYHPPIGHGIKKSWSHPNPDMPTPASNREMKRGGEDLVCLNEYGFGEVYTRVLQENA